MKTAVILILFFINGSGVVFAQTSQEEAEAWFEDDSEWQALQVNEGELQFIQPIENTPILHSKSEFWLDENSLQSGWVKLKQCYSGLDAVGRTDVVYAYEAMRSLQVTYTKQISSYTVAGNKVELEDVQAGAELCVQAQVKIFQVLGDGRYRIRNGPYHRKFFDGYYPYHVSITIDYSGVPLSFRSVQPPPQPGFDVKVRPSGLFIDSWFEGVLELQIEFDATH